MTFPYIVENFIAILLIRAKCNKRVQIMETRKCFAIKLSKLFQNCAREKKFCRILNTERSRSFQLRILRYLTVHKMTFSSSFFPLYSNDSNSLSVYFKPRATKFIVARKKLAGMLYCKFL